MKQSTTFLLAVALGVLTAYAFPCYWGDCQDLPCASGCGVPTGSPTTSHFCHQDGNTCCMCEQAIRACTICGYTTDASTIANGGETCVSNHRICEP